jgi:hypothetical protein
VFGKARLLVRQIPAHFVLLTFDITLILGLNLDLLDDLRIRQARIDRHSPKRSVIKAGSSHPVGAAGHAAVFVLERLAEESVASSSVTFAG